ncbi:MAG: hypothetical protein ACYSUC_04955 [Planctomycetota bacterium]|jgi:hypothetical protein
MWIADSVTLFSNLLRHVSPLVVATFTSPENIGTSPASLLWMLPLAASITVVYKATKLPKITAASFIKETAALFGSIVVFIIISMFVLHALAWLITE